ncbi:MAG: DUF4962 domain-containing protein [Chitinispirillaceae bacterium]|nr:DUF4962 domain-containing protein [Chitinispirillaceae bacterium]
MQFNLSLFSPVTPTYNVDGGSDKEENPVSRCIERKVIMQRIHSILSNHIMLQLSVFVMFFLAHHARAAHPSIFFSAADIPEIRRKATSSHAAIMKPILSQASSLLSLSVPAAPVGADYSKLSLASRDVTVLAFAFVATGDSRYLAAGRKYLVSFASWPYWGADSKLGDRDLTLGFMLRACATAYDWMYDSLSTSDRAAVHGALVKHAREMYEAASGPYNSTWANWWTQSFGQNHWDNNNSALGIAALVLDGECDSSGTWLNHAILEMRRDSFNLANIEDGTWHEGCLYQNSKLTATMPFYVNLKRLKGIDLFPESYLAAYALFALYNYLPSNRQMVLTFSSYLRDWGGWLSAAGYSLLSLAASACNSGYAQWLWNKMETELGRSSYQAGNHIPEFFYYDPSITAVPPTDLPLSRTLSDLEGVIWRTGWGDDELTFGLKTGSYGGRFLYNQYLSRKYPFDTDDANLNVGHNHADANTFWLYRGNVTLIGENEGRSLYNDLNSAYQSSSHNTLLVDNKGQYFPTNQTGVYADNDGALLFSSSVHGYDFVATDASRRYRATNSDKLIGPPMISLFVRNVLFVRPSYFVIVDNVADSSEHAYEMRFHFGDSAKIDTGLGWIRALYAQDNMVGVRTLAPFPCGFREVDSIRPAACVTPPQRVKRMDFAFVVYPCLSSEWTGKPEFTAIQNASATSVHVSGDIAFDHIVRHADAVDTVIIGGHVIDGRTASVGRSADGRIRDLFLADGAMIADSGGVRTLLQSSNNVNAVHVAIADTAVTVYLDRKGDADLRIYAPGTDPELVTVPGWNAAATNEGDYLLISGAAPVNERGFAGRNNRNDAMFFVKGGKAVCLRPDRSGMMTVSAYCLDGKCLWKSARRFVNDGCVVDIPCDLRRSGSSVVVVIVDIDGVKATQSLLQQSRQ